MSELPPGSLVVLTPEGAAAIPAESADTPDPNLHRAVLGHLSSLGLRKDVMTALVFVIQGDEQEVELCRDTVQAEDVAGLARAYWCLPSWTQRTCLVHLVCDHGADGALSSIWSDILRAPALGDGDGRHYAKVIALWSMSGATGDMMAFDDETLVAEATSALASTVTLPPSFA